MAGRKKRNDKLEIYNKYLFDYDIKSLSKNEQDKVLRIRESFTIWMNKPYLKAGQVVKYLKDKFSISDKTGWDDISIVQNLLGNVQNPVKAWQRYTAIEMIKSGYQLILQVKNNDKTEEDKPKKDPDVLLKMADLMIKAGVALGKVTVLHKDDIEKPDWKKFIPSPLIPSDDPSLVGWDESKDGKLDDMIKLLKDKYHAKELFEDATIIE